MGENDEGEIDKQSIGVDDRVQDRKQNQDVHDEDG